jgi:hypothetical protein
MNRNTMTADRPILKLVSAPSQDADHLQELRRRVGAAGLLVEALKDELAKAKAALVALEGGKS